MPRRDFHFVDTESAKFWSIEWQDDAYTVHFGRIDTQGQSQTRKLATPKDTASFCQKAIAEKLKKGYVEVTVAVSEVPDSMPPDSPLAPPAPDLLAPPPFLDNSTTAPEIPVLLDVLRLLEAPPEEIAKFPSQPKDLAWSFADTLADAPAAIYTDWRFHPSEVLNEVWQRIYPYQVKGMIEEEDEENGFPKKIILQVGQVGSRYRIRIKGEEPCLHDILFALDRVLPADLRILSVLPFEASDTYLHLIHPLPTWIKAREALGPWFWKVFSKHDTPLSFTKMGGNVKPKRNQLKKALKNYKEWLLRQEEWHAKMPGEIRGILEKNINDPELRPSYAGAVPKEKRKRDLEKWLALMATPQRLRMIGGSLNYLANGMMTEGVVQLLESQPQGWERIHLALRYQFVAVRLSLQFGGIIDHLVDHGARLIALAWALGDLKIVDWLSQDFLNNPRHFKGWEFNPLQPFLLQLYALWKGMEIDWTRYPKAKLGVYQQVIQTWNDPAKLVYALEICCDYHTLRTGESGYQEFSWTPYDIFPVEILAIYRLRQLQHLPVPHVSHELLDSPLGKLPEPVQSTPDDLLESIMTVIEKELPELGEEMKAFE